jgi:hypothetical protein
VIVAMSNGWPSIIAQGISHGDCESLLVFNDGDFSEK